jgi:hypothetical protein
VESHSQFYVHLLYVQNSEYFHYNDGLENITPSVLNYRSMTAAARFFDGVVNGSDKQGDVEKYGTWSPK